MAADEERAFFDRLRDAPADDGPRLIYADWLAESGQPDRAEFIRVQCALDRLPHDDPAAVPLRERERQLLDADEAEWTAALRPLVSALSFRRGVVDSVSLTARQFLKFGDVLFDLAPIRKVRFVDVAAHIDQIARSPHLRRVREIDLSGNVLRANGAAALALSSHLGGLEGLDLSFTELDGAALQVLAHRPAFGRLHWLKLNGNEWLDARGLRALAESPHLASLTDVDVGGNQLTPAALRPLLRRRLERLALADNPLGDGGVIEFAASPVFARMAARDHAIDLRRVEMGPGGARALAESPALADVESLELGGNFIGDGGLAALALSPNLARLRSLSLRENRISDEGVRSLARSRLLATLREVDLIGNLITQESLDRLHEGSVAFDWRGLLRIKADSQLRSRPHLPAAMRINAG